MRPFGALWLGLLVPLFVGCQREEGGKWDIPRVDHSVVEVGAEKLLLTRGPVGEGRFRAEATYVLVDAQNHHLADVMVTLGGDLLDERGEVIGPLRRQSLRIPGGGGIRMFSLIDDENRLREAAASARVEVKGAVETSHRSLVVIRDGRVDIDQGRAVVAGNVVNTAQSEIAVIVFGAFYDRDGHPMKQTSTLFRIAGEGQRGVQFVGPEGSRKAFLYVGDALY